MYSLGLWDSESGGNGIIPPNAGKEQEEGFVAAVSESEFTSGQGDCKAVL
jgi:hypothetical protein